MISNLINNPKALVPLVFLFLLLISVEQRNLFVDRLNLILIFIFFSIVIGMRTYDSGSDTLTYLYYFNALGENNDASVRSLDLGFGSITRLLYYINSESWFYLFSIFSLTFVTFFFANRKVSTYLSSYFVCFIAFLVGLDLISNGIRNGLALAFCFAFFICILRDRAYLSILWLILAICIHSSSMIYLVFFLPTIFFDDNSKRKLDIVFLIYLIFVLFSILGLTKPIIEGIISIIPFGGISSRVSAFAAQESDMLAGYMKYYFLVITLLPYFMFYNKSDFHRVLICMYIILLPYGLMFFSPSSYRFSFIAYPLIVYVLSNFSILDRNKRTALYIILLTSIIVTYGTNTFTAYEVNL